MVYVVVGCGAVEHQSPIFDQIVRERNLVDEFVYLDRSREDAEKLLDSFGVKPHLSPATIVLEHGRAVDMIMGSRSGDGTDADHKVLLHLLHRNGFIESGPRYVVDHTTENGRRARGKKYHDGDNLSGLDLSSAYFQNGSFGGANLQSADLRNADLRHANMSHADLTGARLEGAKLEGVWWKDTICPDGSQAQSTDDGCTGHIDP